MNRTIRFVLCACLVSSAAATSALTAEADKPAKEKATDSKTAVDKSKTAEPAGKVRSLFDGKTLNNWKSTRFGGEGDVTVKDGTIVLDMGADMTGITWSGGALPTNNYEISLDAMRLEGNDFFCGLTFPVDKSSCSLIVGGWGGGVVGLSSIDGFDASENSTTEYVSFESNKWYAIRLRVTPNRIQAWIDNEKLVDHDTTDQELSVRAEVDLSRPLGVATWSTRGALRNIKLTTLPAATAGKK